MAETPPDSVAGICPGCGAPMGDEAACGGCQTPRPTTYVLLPPNQLALGTLVIAGAMCVAGMGLMGVMPRTPGFVGGGLLLVFAFGLMGVSVWGLQRPTREWELTAADASAKVTVDDKGVVQVAYGSRTRRGPVQTDLKALATVSDADLAAAVDEVAAARKGTALAILRALAQMARGTLVVEVVEALRWSHDSEVAAGVHERVIEEVVVVGEPDWLAEQALVEVAAGDGGEVAVGWLAEHQEWRRFLGQG